MNSTVRLATFAVLIAPLPIVGSVICTPIPLSTSRAIPQTTAFVNVNRHLHRPFELLHMRQYRRPGLAGRFDFRRHYDH